MKVCPKCGSVSPDDAQRFCLMDGLEMVPANSEPTVVMPRSDPAVVVAPKNKSSFFWILLGLLILLVGGGLVTALMFAAYKMGSESARVTVNNAATPTPKASPTRQMTPEASPSTQVTPSASATRTPGPGNSSEPTPITWRTAATTFKVEPGLTYTFACPPGGTAAIIWGSAIYTADSSICTAAVHAGEIDLEDGGEVTIELIVGRQTYGATTRNGITSNNFGPFPYSFTFR